MSLDKTVNDILNKMHRQSATDKGRYGEKAAFSICEDLYQRRGGILIHSYEYRTVPELAGNIKKQGGRFYVENTGSCTEIDILLVTPFKFYPIEVKAYRANTITLTNEGISGCAVTNKSPVHQNEMHMRHLYPHVFKSLPDGSTSFVVPIVVFVDNCSVVDKRTPDNREYINVTVLNQLRALLEYHDKPYNGFRLDLPFIEASLRSCMVSSEAFLPYVRR